MCLNDRTIVEYYMRTENMTEEEIITIFKEHAIENEDA